MLRQLQSPQAAQPRESLLQQVHMSFQILGRLGRPCGLAMCKQRQSQDHPFYALRAVKAAAGGGDPLEEPPHGSEVRQQSYCSRVGIGTT